MNKQRTLSIIVSLIVSTLFLISVAYAVPPISLEKDVPRSLLTANPTTIILSIYDAQTGGTQLATQSFQLGQWFADYSFIKWDSLNQVGIEMVRFKVDNFINTAGITESDQDLWVEIDLYGTGSVGGRERIKNVAWSLFPQKSALDLEIPDGLINTSPVLTQVTQVISYTVPPGKNLYISDFYSLDGVFFTINGVLFNGYAHTNYSSLFIMGENMVIQSTGNPININGYLVNKKKDFIVHDLNTSNYTVPNGKILIITAHDTSFNSSGSVSINGLYFYKVSIAHSGEVLSGNSKFIGYLINQ